MIVTRLISGLGNQLLQYAIGRQLSIIKEVPLKLDTSFFTDQNLRSYKLDHFNIDAQVAIESDINPFKKEIKRYQDLHQQTSISAKVYRKLEPVFFPKHTKNYFKESTWWILEPNIFKTPKDVYIDGYWQHYKYFENMPAQIFKELTFKEPLNGEAENWQSRIKNDPFSVAVHIRRGDYVTDSGANYLMGVLPLTYYQKAINYMEQKVLSPTFYFFSDDLDWVKQHVKTNSLNYYVYNNPDYIDLKLMQNCSHNIIANSTFSWWGAVLNSNPHKVIIAPDKWSAIEDVNRNIHLQFPTWIKL